MLPQRRQAEIVSRVRRDGATSVQDLARELGVSSSTIRRDLHLPDRDGAVTRVWGGALLQLDADHDRPFAAVAAVDAAAKDAVARRAAALVEDGDVLLLDIGTTTRALARELRGRRVTVLTSSLAVLDVLRDDPAVQLVLLGGAVRRTYHSLVGTLTEDALRQVHADRLFLGASGVRTDGQVLDTTVVEVPVKRAMLTAAEQVVLLADAGKLPGTGALRVCGPEALDILVTSTGGDERCLEACTAAGVEVLVA